MSEQMAGSDVTICGFGFEWVNPGGGEKNNCHQSFASDIFKTICPNICKVEIYSHAHLFIYCYIVILRGLQEQWY